MAEFQKSLIRFMYVALALVVVISIWALSRTTPTQALASSSRYRGSENGVTATGTCVVRTKPELVEVVLGVSQSSKTAQAAKSYVKSTCSKIIASLEQNGVARKDIQTQRFSLTSQWDSGKGWQVIKWNSEESLKVRIRDVDNVANIIDQAAKAGANRIGSLNYTVDNVNDIRAKGRVKAAAVARKKAQELASSLGGKLGRLVSCNESYPGNYGDYYNGYWPYNSPINASYANAQVTASSDDQPANSSSPEELTIQPGEMVTTVVVTARYELE